MNSLELLVHEVREYLEVHSQQIRAPKLHSFPDDCCEIASTILHEVLILSGFDSEVVKGYNGDDYHCWIRCDGNHIDITWDQMSGQTALFFLSEKTEPYAAYEIELTSRQNYESFTEAFPPKFFDSPKDIAMNILAKIEELH